mgnify:CR=1 FL=1
MNKNANQKLSELQNLALNAVNANDEKRNTRIKRVRQTHRT